jgi:hypothetical protein
MSKQQERGILEELADFFSPSDPEPRDIKTWLLGKTIPCFLCKRDLDIRFSKKDRPYTVCTECQIQTFIRGRKGFERLVTLVKEQEE